MNFHQMTYMTMPQHKNPCPMDHYIYNFGWPSLAYRDYILCSGVHIYPKIIFPRGGGGLKFLVSFTYRCYIRYLVIIKIYVNGRQRTPSHSKKLCEWLRWPRNLICGKILHMIIVAISLMHFYHKCFFHYNGYHILG